MSVSPFASIAELGAALRKKQVSSLELTEMYLSRLKTLGAEHRAVAELTEERAREQAKRADATPRKGPLHGIPFGVKDLFATKGIPTRWGSPGHADQVFDFDATVVERLQNAGGVLVAKLEMIALAGGGNYNQADASRMGACLCAWDKTLWAGGSSSGSGAATALGCVGYAIGTETSGSILCPCAFNGVSGIRPTYGRVSRHGAMALAWTLDKIGPIARSIEDCALVLSAIAGPDPKDETTQMPRLDLRPRGPRPRLGLIKESFEPLSEVAKAYDQALAVFRKLGYETVEVKLPELPYDLAMGILVDAEGASAHERFIRSERLHLLPDKQQMAGLAASLATPATDYLWAQRIRREALAANAIWDSCDCLFSPVFYKRSLPVDKPFSETWSGMGGDLITPSNLLGWPAAAFPIGFDGGAPPGGQAIAPAYREDVCVRVAQDFQRETDFHRRHPAV